MRITIDGSGRPLAMVQARLARDPAGYVALAHETRRMVAAGAHIEDVVWMLLDGPGSAADRRQELEADAPNPDSAPVAYVSGGSS